jgi:hypothetical protein
MPQDRYIDFSGRSRDNAIGDDKNYHTTTSSVGKVERLLLMHKGKWLADDDGELGNQMWIERLHNTENDRALIAVWSEEAVSPLVELGLIKTFETTVKSTDGSSAEITWTWRDMATQRQVSTSTIYRWGT